MQDPKRASSKGENAEFYDALKKGLVVGAGLLVLIVPPLRMHQAHQAQLQQQQEQAAQVAANRAPSAAATPAPEAAAPRAQVPGVRLADFRGEEPSRDARLTANWVVATGNAQRHAFVVVDKKDARVYVFQPDGKLKESAPALMGSARGDDSFPGIGDKPLAQVRPEEKTTPAGRFVAEPGRNATNEDIVWVDYDAAVSMHRIRPLVAKERRLERLASLTTDDNRISFGCINLPVSFYENVLSPTVQKYGAIVYVLPEVKTLQQVFGAYDVTDPMQVAAAREAKSSNVRKVALQTSAR